MKIVLYSSVALFLIECQHLNQKMIPLIHDPVVVGKIAEIYFVELGKLQIYKSSSLGGTIFYNVQILRRKKYDVDNTEQFARPADGHLVDCYPFRTFLLQVDVDLIAYSPLLNIRLYVGLILPEPYHIPVLCPPVGFRGAAQIDGLQDIGLSLGIIPVKDIDRIAGRNLQQFIVSEILQF